MNSGASALTQARLKKLLHYDPDTGVFTQRMNRRGGAKAGDVAGHTNSYGQWRTHVDGRIHTTGRLAWLYMNGTFPPNGKFINFKDGDPTNLRWRNLRLATDSQKRSAHRLPSNNTSGVKGVSWFKHEQKFYACIKVNHKRHHLGRFDTLEEATRARKTAERKYYGAFAGPTKPQLLRATEPKLISRHTDPRVTGFNLQDMSRFATEAWGKLGGAAVDRWAEFNAKYFDGELRPVPIVFTRTQPFGGRFVNCSRCDGQRQITLTVPVQRKSLKANNGALLHAMIHQLLHERGESSKHDGEPWRREIMRLHKLITGTEIWAGKRTTKRIPDETRRPKIVIFMRHGRRRVKRVPWTNLIYA